MRLKHFNSVVGIQIFKALSEIPRLRIIYLLIHRPPLSTSDLELILDYTQAKTSRHLTYLKNLGLVSNKRIDQWVLYTVNDELIDVITQILKYMEKDIQLKKDLETCDILDSNRELTSNKLKVKRKLSEEI